MSGTLMRCLVAGGLLLLCTGLAAPAHQARAAGLVVGQAAALSGQAAITDDLGARHADDQSAGTLDGMTVYILGLGALLTVIAVVGLRTCAHQHGARGYRRHRRW